MGLDLHIDGWLWDLPPEGDDPVEEDPPHPFDVYLNSLHGLSHADMDILDKCWSRTTQGEEFALAWEQGARLLTSVRFTKHIYELVPTWNLGARQTMIALFMALMLADQLPPDTCEVLLRPWNLYQSRI